MNMNFGTNKTPVEVIEEGAFRGSYFRDIYSGFGGILDIVSVEYL